MRLPAGNRLALALISCGLTTAFFIDFCGLVYQCGCKSLWNGAAGSCNIHSPSIHHCPWCSIGTLGAVIVWLTVVAVQSLIALRLDAMPLTARVALTFAAFPLVGGLIALILGLVTNYWN